MFSEAEKGSRVSQIKGAPTEADAPYCSNALTEACRRNWRLVVFSTSLASPMLRSL